MTAKKREKRLKKQHAARCDDILARLAAVSEGYDMVTFLNDHKIEICFEKDALFEAASSLTIDRIENGKYIYVGTKIILNESLHDDNIAQALVHEAQHMRHHMNDLGNPDMLLSLEDHQLFRAVQEADAQAAAIDVTFKLKLAGDAGPYEKTAAVGYEEMCRAYEAAYEADPQSIYDGRAKRAAFDAWFTKPSRVAHYDHDTENLHEKIIENLCAKSKEHGLSAGALENDWVERIGGLSDVNYLHLPGQSDPLSTARATLTETRKEIAKIAAEKQAEKTANDNEKPAAALENNPQPKSPPPPSQNL
ncbi:MAG: hypothetical protein HND56_09325 [Pseudomonadota bacterium]|nr:hypothetical protein [Pseudomonadota bacterium]QKK05876.1 MAG: hypothetical protein HND56_09325 [Pseudomonadota bacterium]